MSACGIAGGSATNETVHTICRELLDAAPTVSIEDTERTRREAETFFAVLDAACEEGRQ